jgi:thiol-disulfide isomerase/thioredoxin
MRLLLASAMLILAFSGRAAAQVPAQQSSQTPTANVAQVPSSQQPAQSNNFIQPEQPVSLGDLARMLRAKKNSQAKAVKIFDDDNMPRAPHKGDVAPEFAESHGASSNSRGKVILLDFWATWCGPCRHSLPGLKQLQRVYGSDRLKVISISEDEDEDAWHEFVDENRMNWEQRLDDHHEMMRRYGANALPTFILIGSDGKVLQQWVGDDEDQSLVDRMRPDLESALAKKS